MIIANLKLAIVSLGLLLILISPVLGGHRIVWNTYSNGHLKLWWTKDGYRDPHPFVDDDIVAPEGGYHLDHISPRDDINDCHSQWILSSTGKASNTNAVAGLGYPFPTFEDYFNASPYESVTWLELADGMGLSDVEVTVDLVAWGDHLQFNPLPDPAEIFLFDASGLCPALPGYEAVNLTAGTPFVGEMETVATTTLENIESFLLGDANNDDVVSAGDYATVQANFGNTGISGGELLGDANGDGVVSAGDYASVQANFGNIFPTLTPTPEPATLSLLVIGGLALIKRRRK
jgi:hypothetical protein